MASRPPAFDTVSAESEYHGPGVPQLGLAGGAETRRTAAYRVYVLRCAPPRDNAPFRWYVGLAHKSQIAKRLRDQFQGGARAADFVRRARAIQVELVWPAETPAAEALVFYALLARLPAAAVAAGRLGGWTQTQAHPSDFSALVLERDRRMLVGSCLSCGQSTHVARDCPRPFPDACELTCGRCAGPVYVSSLGAVRPVQPRPPALPVAAAAHATSRKRPQRATADVPAATRQPPGAAPPPYARVRVCGHAYTTLTWFNGGRQPGPKKRKTVCERCGANALELQGGDCKSLQAGGFATPAGKELFPGATTLPTAWTATACTSVLSQERVKARRAGGRVAGRGCLWRVSELQAVLEPR